MRKYRVNADSWMVLRDILVGTPEEFNPDSASLRGRTIGYNGRYPLPVGRLDGDARREFDDDWDKGCIRFIIYSYATPIAWRRIESWNRDGTVNYEWVMPDVKYSVTTSKHQGRVATAISQIN